MTSRIKINSSGFKVSAPTYDVNTATTYQLLFDSTAGEMLSINQTGSILLSTGDPYTISFTTMPYSPLVCVMGDSVPASNPGTSYWVGGWYWAVYGTSTGGYPDQMDYMAGFDFTVTPSDITIYPGSIRSFRYTIFNTGFVL